MNKRHKRTAIRLDINDLLHPKSPTPKYNSQETLDAVAEIETLDEEIEAYLRSNYPGIKNGMMGFCHFYWAAKKSILSNKYGIEWFSPAEENPNALYD
ncbi:MAG: hypothetical protein HDT08_05475 [Bacteroidales bacterium]|nr:hypothetical protein [Bacteroidales bacterium]